MAASLRGLARDPRVTVRRLIRRHRRPLAAALAGLGAVLLLISVRATPTGASSVPTPPGRSDVDAGEVAVPVVLASSALASVLDVGDVIDLVAVSADDPASARLLAPRARVVELPSGGSALSASSSAVIIVAVDESEALALSAESTGGGVTVVIHGR
jgi:hypothetical protein